MGETLSIATRRGDRGQTDLAGGVRVSKASLRVDGYGTIDELISQIGFARSITRKAEVGGILKTLQRELYRVGAAVSTAPGKETEASKITDEMLAGLDAHVRRIESIDGIVGDWTLPGELPDAAAIDVARTICRRAERMVVRLQEADEPVPGGVIVYLNRLSDLLWLLSRQLEVEAGVDSRLREPDSGGKPWSPAW